MVTVFSIFFSMSGTSDVFRSPCKEIKKKKFTIIEATYSELPGSKG